MNNDIIKLLNLEDDCIINSIRINDDRSKTISISKKLTEQFCPLCNCKMHSKGIRIRKVKHQILLDGYQLELELNCRRYQCINPTCHHMKTDSFNCIDKYRRVTNTTDFLIIESFRDYTLTFSAIARRFKVSPSYVHNVFKRYIHMDRLPLGQVLSIDEIHLKDDHNGKYALVLHDFITGQPIDIISSRRQNVTEAYFASISIAERRCVKYLITDMYRPFINYASKYFPNAIVAVDSFHVVHWILNEIQKYIRSLTRQYLKRDVDRHQKREAELKRTLTLHQSDEVYILKKYAWLVLTMTIYDKEDKLFALAPELQEMRNLKELYIKFNKTRFENSNEAVPELARIIEIYSCSSHAMFRSYAELLNSYFDEIISSFTWIDLIDENGVVFEKRLSNGPIESFNRIPKDMKRNSRGYLDFDHARNRILFATRKDAAIKAPKK